MNEVRDMTPGEIRRLRRVLRKIAPPGLVDREAFWMLFLSVSAGLGVFTLLKEFLFGRLLPERPAVGMALSAGAGLALALASTAFFHRLRVKIADRMRPYREKLLEDERTGVVRVYTDDHVTSYFDLDPESGTRDLVIRFPEGEVHVDGLMCERQDISEPVTGRCRVVCLPRSGHVIEITT
jgi:hypothetical protein